MSNDDYALWCHDCNEWLRVGRTKWQATQDKNQHIREKGCAAASVSVLRETSL